MDSQEFFGSDGGPIDPNEDSAKILTGDCLWKIATGEAECSNDKLRIEARRYAAVKMRQQGKQYREIAETLQCSLNWAWQLVQSALSRAMDEPSDSVRKLHLRRLESMLEKQLKKADEGNSFAVTVALQLMGKIEALLGIEPPKKIEHTFGDMAVDDARTQLAKAIAASSGKKRDNGDSGEPAV